MNGAEALDDYLEGLLQAAAGTLAAAPQASIAEAPPAPAAAPVADDVIAEMLADPAFAGDSPAPATAAQARIATDLIAEMLSDPAFAEPGTKADAGTASQRIAADLLAEMEADPAFAAPATAAPDPIAAAVLAEMDGDPAFAAATPAPTALLAADLIAEMEGDPAFAEAAEESAVADEDPTEREAVAEMQMMQADRLRRPAPAAPAAPARPQPARAPRPANALPRHVQALFRPADADHPQAPLHAAERSSRWLRLRCGEQAYALELLKVQEVVLPTPLLRLRGTSRSMLGIMNLRGLVVPVLDLGLYLGASPVDLDPHTRVVVLEENGETMGLRVSAVEDVTTLVDQQIEPPDNTRLCKISNQFFRGVARLGQRPMILLDATQLLH